VFGFGRELGAIILRKDAVPAQQFGQRRARCTDERGTGVERIALGQISSTDPERISSLGKRPSSLFQVDVAGGSLGLPASAGLWSDAIITLRPAKQSNG
jgi:hypothetical protein